MGKIAERREQISRALVTILEDEAAGSVVERQEAEQLRQRFGDRKVALVSFDVDKIKDLVFTSTAPLNIHGASEIVKDLTLQQEREGEQGEGLPSCSVYRILKEKGLTEDHVIFAGGGTGLLMVPAGDKAKEIAQAIQDRFAERSQTGSCTAVYRELAPHELIVGLEPVKAPAGLPPGVVMGCGDGASERDFGELVRLLADELRQAKEERLRPPIPLLPGYVHRCESCGIRAASERDVRPEGEEKWLCPSCHAHRRRGQEERERLERFEPGFETAQSINEIAGLEAERGYVGILYADANGMGQKLFSMKRMEDYALFSQAVYAVFTKVTRKIITDHKLAGRYQAPILGGDDILLLVPATKVAAIVKDLLEQVRAGCEAEAGKIEQEAPNSQAAKALKDITLSAGLVIVPAHFNIRFSVDYAEALLRQAKEKRHDVLQKLEADKQKSQVEKEDEGRRVQCIDWMVIKEGSPLGLDIRELRERTLLRQAPETATRAWKLRLTTKPVTFERFCDFLEWMGVLDKAGVSHSQLMQIQSLLEAESPRAAKLNILYQWLRVDEWKDEHNGFFARVGRSPEQWLSEFILHETALDEYETGFIDLLELYEIVGKEEG